VESGDIAVGYYPSGRKKPLIDDGFVRDETPERYFPREPGFSIFGGKKICIPVMLRKCSFDLSKFNDCLSNIEKLPGKYTLFPFPIPGFNNIVSPFLPELPGIRLPPIGNNCWTGAFEIVQKCATAAKR